MSKTLICWRNELKIVIIILQANTKFFTYESKKSIDVGDDNDIYEKDLGANIVCKQNVSQQCGVGLLQ